MQIAQTPVMTERRTSMIGAFLSVLGPVTMSLYTPAMPTLVHAFGTTDAAAKMTLTFFFAGFAVSQLIAGPASDALGRRRSTVIFMFVYLVGSVMAVLAPTIEWLMAARLIQGIGASIGTTVSRAIIRDQFTGEQSSRIMNTVGIMLSVGPGFAPTLGGVILALSTWQGIFFVMVGFGLTAIGVALLAMKETTIPDPNKARPGPLVASYGKLLASGPVMSASLVIGFASGALYMLATVLPFVLIDEAGLTPSQFGIGMLAQTGSYFVGSLIFRFCLRRWSANVLVVPGIGSVLFGSLLAFLSLQFLPVSYLSVMVPVGFYALGIAFIMPHMATAAMMPFPRIAGTAAAMMGCVQMGLGFVGGMVAAWIDNPVLSLHLLLPGMGLLAAASYIWHERSIAKFFAAQTGADG